MRRSNILSVTIFLILMAISACVKSFSPGPTYEPLPDENFIKTSVGATLTALAPATLTASPTALFTQTLNPGAMTPHDFIYYYFDNINRRNYSLTWSLLTDRFKARLNSPSQGGYEGYVAFWNSVEQVTVNNAFYVCNGDLSAVNTSLQLNYTNGVDNTSPYDYTVIYDHSLNTWMFDFIPAPTAVALQNFYRHAHAYRHCHGNKDQYAHEHGHQDFYGHLVSNGAHADFHAHSNRFGHNQPDTFGYGFADRHLDIHCHRNSDGQPDRDGNANVGAYGRSYAHIYSHGDGVFVTAKRELKQGPSTRSGGGALGGQG